MAQRAVEKREDREKIFTGAFSTFSIGDTPKAKEFYGETLGFDVSNDEEGLSLRLPEGGSVFLYPKDNHEPATFTVLNLEVGDIEKAVDDLNTRGVEFLSYDEPMKTDGKGIYWGKKQGQGPNIAWFEDPFGNILSVMEKG